MDIYEMVEVNRHTEKLEADSLHIGKRYMIHTLSEGACAVLIHADNPNKSLVTSKVERITKLDGINKIKFVTKHTDYTIRKAVVEVEPWTDQFFEEV